MANCIERGNRCPAKFNYAQFEGSFSLRRILIAGPFDRSLYWADAPGTFGNRTVTQEPPAPPTSRIVLIVDDNEPTARALAKVLGAAKFDTAVSYRGGEAVEYAKSHTICAAVVDIHLPDLSGLVVTQKLRQHLGPAMPIIVLSGDTSMETLNSLGHVGATYFFSKPVNSSQLIERLQNSLESGCDENADA
jgi:CheY-like chemotaxis protein